MINPRSVGTASSFFFQDADTKVMRGWVVEYILRDIESGALQLTGLGSPVQLSTAAGLLANNSVDPDRMNQIVQDPERLWAPGIMLHRHWGPMILDGRHRYCARAAIMAQLDPPEDHPIRVMPFWEMTEQQAAPYELDLSEDQPDDAQMARFMGHTSRHVV